MGKLCNHEDLCSIPSTHANGQAKSMWYIFVMQLKRLSRAANLAELVSSRPGRDPV